MINGKAKKKPVEIDWFKWNGDMGMLEDWHTSLDFVPIEEHFIFNDTHGLFVKTLEGTSYVVPTGYIIIRGVEGEYYPCDPTIFEKTYDISNPPFVEPEYTEEEEFFNIFTDLDYQESGSESLEEFFESSKVLDKVYNHLDEDEFDKDDIDLLTFVFIGDKLYMLNYKVATEWCGDFSVRAYVIDYFESSLQSYKEVDEFIIIKKEEDRAIIGRPNPKFKK